MSAHDQAIARLAAGGATADIAIIAIGISIAQRSRIVTLRIDRREDDERSTANSYVNP
jgi:hypothetical protein